MKRKVIIFLIISFLCLTGFTYAVIKSLCNKNSLTITETTRVGDAAKAEGLRITFSAWPAIEGTSADGGYMKMEPKAWDSTIYYGKAGAAVSYQLVPADEAYQNERDEQYWARLAERYMARNDGTGIRGWNNFSTLYFQEVILKDEAFLEKWEAAGSPSTIRLADYYECYPEFFYDILPYDMGLGYGSGFYYVRKIREGHLVLTEDNLKSEPVSQTEAAEVFLKFSELLKIPVLSDEQWQLSEGTQSDWRPIGKKYYCPEFYNVGNEEALFFTFDAKAKDGSCVDTSMLPGGYGIYKIPTYHEVRNGINFQLYEYDKLQMFYPIKQDWSILKLGITLNGKALLLVYAADGECHARIMDSATAETLADFILGSEAEFMSGNGTELVLKDDYIVLKLLKQENSRIFVIGQSEGGQWEVLMQTTAYASQHDITLHDVAFDVNRLAEVSYKNGSFQIIVYSKDGTEYQGEVQTSLRIDDYELENIGIISCYWD